MTTTPVPPTGFHVVDATPTSQQQAQDTVIGYLRKTLKELPPGTVFDDSRYPGSGKTPCTDQSTGTPPNEYADKRQAIFPPGTNAEAMITKMGQIWTSWGWQVGERDGFRKPNQFGYGPDGYAIQVVASNPPGYPPTITGVSPCYPGDLASDNVPVPAVLDSEGNPTKAVGETFNVQQRMASKYVERARQRGYLPATKRGQKRA